LIDACPAAGVNLTGQWSPARKSAYKSSKVPVDPAC